MKSGFAKIQAIFVAFAFFSVGLYVDHASAQITLRPGAESEIGGIRVRCDAPQAQRQAEYLCSCIVVSSVGSTFYYDKDGAVVISVHPGTRIDDIKLLATTQCQIAKKNSRSGNCEPVQGGRQNQSTSTQRLRH
jgi:hypothetical protein